MGNKVDTWKKKHWFCCQCCIQGIIVFFQASTKTHSKVVRRIFLNIRANTEPWIMNSNFYKKKNDCKLFMNSILLPVTCSRRKERVFLEACRVTCYARSKQWFADNVSINNNEGCVRIDPLLWRWTEGWRWGEEVPARWWVSSSNEEAVFFTLCLQKLLRWSVGNVFL